MLSILAIAAIPGAFAQQPPAGADISTAIPIYYGQFVNDIGDVHTNPLHVYSVTLAKGQQFSAVASVAATDASPQMQVALFPPTQKTVGTVRWNDAPGSLAFSANNGRSVTVSLATVPASGTYYITFAVNSIGVSYTLQVTTTGTPQLQTLPAQAGCLSGQVDFITYSLQLIALNLPDTISVGGTQACATCNIKPPLYSQITEKIELALRSGLPVQACYDANGAIFQISLQHQ
jgi:hypothetical protein